MINHLKCFKTKKIGERGGLGGGLIGPVFFATARSREIVPIRGLVGAGGVEDCAHYETIL